MNNAKHDNTKWILLAGITAAIASTFCCITPLILFSIGIGGAWMGHLAAMEPYRPYFLTMAFIFIAFGFWKVYRKPQPSICKSGILCERPGSSRINKVMLWVALIILGLVLIYPYVATIIMA